MMNTQNKTDVLARFVRAGLDRIAVKLTTLLLGLMTISSSAQSPAELIDIVHSRLSGDDVQINFVIDGAVRKPGVFATDEPARLAFDFFGTRALLDSSNIDIKAGMVDSVVAIEAGDRTRVVVNLFDAARYDLLPSTNGFSVTIYNRDGDRSRRVDPKPFAARPAIVAETQVDRVDFRRSSQGGGSLSIDMSDTGVTVDTLERDGEIVVDLFNITLPKDLERRLDVVDFATPVRTVDAFQDDTNVRFIVVAEGPYQHLSFQTESFYSSSRSNH